jgi:hypothetical protein
VQRNRHWRHHQDRHHVVHEHRNHARKKRKDHGKEPRPTAGESQRLHREPARHAGLAEVAGDHPDRNQDRHHVPVHQLESIGLGHGIHPHHHHDPDQRRRGAVYDVGDHAQNRDRKHDQR